MVRTKISSLFGKITILVMVGLCVNTTLALDGSGTEGDPWLIQSLGDFDEFAGDPNYWDDYTRLETDVNLAGRVYDRAVIAPDTDSSNWDFDGTLFTGVFNGNENMVIGLTIDDGGAGNKYLGLFGFIDDQGVVKNLGVEGTSVSGDYYVGGLVGRNGDGVVLNCYSTGSVSGTGSGVGGLVGISEDGIISNCYSTSSVSGTGSVGGLVGSNIDGNVSNSSASGSVSGTRSVGGLAGTNGTGNISNCYSTGSVSGTKRVGGLIGYNGRFVLNCFSTGDVDGASETGGLVGRNYPYGDVSGCFWDTATQTHGVAETIGFNEGNVKDIVGLPTAQMQAKSTFTDVGWDFLGESANGTSETWQIPSGGGYPVLSYFHIDVPVPLAGSGTVADPYLIADATELGMVSWYPDGCHFKLTNDIDLSEINWSVAVVPAFGGYFDGDGHRLLNMQISGGGYLGFFGYVGGDCQVKNLGLEGGSVSGIGKYVGGLAGKNYGSIWKCYSTSGVNYGRFFVGGLVGENHGSMTNCCSNGSVSGSSFIGGLAGDNYGPISDCYSTSSVSGIGPYIGGLLARNENSVSNCSYTGDVSGEENVGGLVGRNNYGRVSKCYSAGSVSGEKSVGGLMGRNYYGSLLNCYSVADVNRIGYGGDFGGLVGRNDYGRVSDCNSKGDVRGFGNVGGLVGRNDYGRVSDCNSTGNVSGYYVGGLMGYNYEGFISDCHSTGKAVGSRVGGLVGRNDGSVSRCSSTGEVNGAGDYVGGLVGRNAEIVSNCYSTGKVSGTAAYAGGLVGRNDGSVSNCYSAGDISGTGENVGGLVGRNDGSVSNCYSIGNVSRAGDYFGGLIGRNYSYGDVSVCFWDTDAQTHGVAETIGFNEGNVKDIVGLPTAQMQAKSTFTDVGWDFLGELANGTSETWQIPSGGGYPVLSYFHIDVPVPLAGSGTVADPYLIADATELGMVSWYPDGCHFKLTNDIDLSEINWSVAVVPAFGGNFDGGSHRLLNMQISGGGYLGFFGYVGGDCQVKNLGLEGGSVSGIGNLIGGLVGSNNGTISNCYSTGDVNGVRIVGGLVGENWEGRISSSYSTGDVRGLGNVGGLVGNNALEGYVFTCYSTGNVIGYENAGGLVGLNYYGFIAGCYSTGSVGGFWDIGGLVGANLPDSFVYDCFWDIDTQQDGVTESVGSNEGIVVYVLGLPTEEMQTENTYDWDFTTPIWTIEEGIDYPHLWWEGMQVPMKLTPNTLNCRSEGNWVKAHITLPEGFTVEDVDADRPAVLHSFGFQSAPLYVFVNKDKVVEIEAAFERQDVCSLVGNWPEELTVVGFLADGNIFLGTSTVRIIHPGMKVIEELASCWLQEDCIYPETDMNKDSLVNLFDYASLMNINVEFVNE